ncbi:MAG: hypothetical protein HQL67_04770 [Magnetococcales bacterium]|nr:hypothetical protein [Magnetococcales bacterium]
MAEVSAQLGVQGCDTPLVGLGEAQGSRLCAAGTPPQAGELGAHSPPGF